jgi:hypothetical protein
MRQVPAEGVVARMLLALPHPQLVSHRLERIRRWKSGRTPQFGPLRAKNMQTVFGLLEKIAAANRDFLA